MDRRGDRSPDVQRAAQRLARPRARAGLAIKRCGDVVLALSMLVVLLPVLVVVLTLLALAGDGWTEQRLRLGRHGRSVTLTRFCSLPGGAFGRSLERIGARELPVLGAVLVGKLSFVGPRVLSPGPGHTGPRRLMAPGLIGPAQRGCADAAAAEALDDAYVATWSLWRDVKLLAGRPPHSAHQSVSNISS